LKLQTSFLSPGIVLENDPHYTAVRTANPTLVTIACESADYRCDEGTCAA
jgi:hypothetical protein